MLMLNNGLSEIKYKTNIGPIEGFLLFFLFHADEYAILNHFRCSYFYFLLGLLGLPKESSKRILKELIRNGYIFAKRRFGYEINASKVINLVESVDNEFLQTIGAGYSRNELLLLLNLKKITRCHKWKIKMNSN